MTHTVKFRRGGTRIEFELPDLPFAGNAFIPSIAVIPLLQHDGEPAVPVVSVGDHVREGQLIARGSIPVHAPIPGVLSAYRTVPLPNGRLGEAAVIALRGSFDITGRRNAENDWKTIPSGDLCRIIEDRGVVETFEGARPLSLSIRGARERNGSTLICRLFDVDPSSPIETMTRAEYPVGVWNGFGIVASAMNAQSVILIDVEGKGQRFPDEGSLKALFGESKVSTITTKSRYPGGSSYRVSRLVGEKHPEVSIEGAVYCDAVTALAAYDAVVRDIPSITVHLLVLGNAVATPRLLKVRTGTLIGDVIDECGGFKASPSRIVVNGLLRGTALYDLDTPVTRYTRSLHVMDRESCPPFGVRDCIHCGSCLNSCPSGIDPIRTVVAIRNRTFGPRDLWSIGACEQCGCCSMVCPSRIPLHHEIAGGKIVAQGARAHD